MIFLITVSSLAVMSNNFSNKPFSKPFPILQSQAFPMEFSRVQNYRNSPSYPKKLSKNVRDACNQANMKGFGMVFRLRQRTTDWPTEYWKNVVEQG